MNDEQVLLNEPKFKVGKFYNFYITSRTKEQIKLSCRANGTARVGNFTVYRYKNGEFICEKADYLSGLSYDDTYYHRIFDCSNTKRVIISTVDFFSALSNDDLVKLYNSKFDFSILDTPKVDLEVVQGEIVESAEQIHNRICDNFAIVEKTLYEICVDLKSIRDNKHYKTLGYNTFEQYCLENFNIKRRQAYNYISIAENLSSDFVQSTAQIGVQKLYCLSRLTDEERFELIQTTDIENTPVKEVEKKAKKIKDNKKNDDDSFSDVPVSASKENQFISMYGKKMNALLKYMKETYNWLFGVNGVSYKSFLGTEKDMPCYDYGTDNIELILKVLPIFCQALKDTANGLIEKDSKADYIKSILVDGVEFDKEVEDNA